MTNFSKRKKYKKPLDRWESRNAKIPSKGHVKSSFISIDIYILVNFCHAVKFVNESKVGYYTARCRGLITGKILYHSHSHRYYFIHGYYIFDACHCHTYCHRCRRVYFGKITGYKQASAFSLLSMAASIRFFLSARFQDDMIGPLASHWFLGSDKEPSWRHEWIGQMEWSLTGISKTWQAMRFSRF